VNSAVRGHELADRRSWLLHREVAKRLRSDPSLLDQARLRVEGWARSGSVHRHYVDAWQRVLASGLPTVLTVLEDPGEEGQSLRQASPFAFVLRPAERWQILRNAGAIEGS
jgi:hypothetical protein